MPLYEANIILRQELAASDVERLTEDFTKIIVDNGGKVAKIEQLGLRNLAYIVKKNKKGHYVYLELDAPYDSVKELERVLGLSDDVLRVLVVKVDEFSELSPVALLKERSSGDSQAAAS